MHNNYIMLLLLPVSLDKSTELIEQFKGWFWLLVERMNNKERQDLVSVIRMHTGKTLCNEINLFSALRTFYMLATRYYRDSVSLLYSCTSGQVRR